MQEGGWAAIHVVWKNSIWNGLQCVDLRTVCYGMVENMAAIWWMSFSWTCTSSLISSKCRIRMWVQDPLNACITYQLKNRQSFVKKLVIALGYNDTQYLFIGGEFWQFWSTLSLKKIDAIWLRSSFFFLIIIIKISLIKASISCILDRE